MSNWLLDLLFPPKCVFCGTLLRKADTHYCLDCLGALPETDDRKQVAFTKGCVAPFRYQGFVRDALLRFKFGNRPFYAEAFGPMIAAKLQGRPADLITWVPVSRLRRFSRGYDQARLLAEATAGALGIPCVGTLHKKHRKKQSGLDGVAARKANISGAFTVTDRTVIAGKTLILIDDICTTGATMEEAAYVLHQAGASEVHGAVFALTDKKNR